MTVTAFPTHLDNQQVKLVPENQMTETGDSVTMFQAIGIIVGSVDISSEGIGSVTIGQFNYPLLYAPRKRRAFAALKQEIENTGNTTLRLIVYPKVIHFPKREQPHLISFQLVGFDQGRLT